MSSYNTASLDNGLRIIHLPSPSPVIYCGYAIAVGTRHETDDDEGMAHFCEHATFKGTSSRTSRDILGYLESVGGDLNAFTNKEMTVYHAAILNDNIDRAVDLLTDIVFHSTYPDEELRKEIDVICDEIESYNDSPADLIFDEFESIIFNGHPLGHNILGTADRLKALKKGKAEISTKGKTEISTKGKTEISKESSRDTGNHSLAREHILRFTGEHYRPDNAVFFAYGDIDFSHLLELLKKHSQDNNTSKQTELSCCKSDSSLRSDSSATANNSLAENPPLPPYQPPLPPYQPCSKTVEKSTHQAHVMLGCRAYGFNSEERWPLYLLNNILGGPGMSARLNLSLRERHALVYSVEGILTSYDDTGLWAIYFGCDQKDVDRCLALVREELDRMMNTMLTDTQLAEAKTQIKGQVAIASDSREAFALGFAKTYLRSGKLKDNQLLFQRIDAITAEELQNVARKLFTPSNLTTLIYK